MSKQKKNRTKEEKQKILKTISEKSDFFDITMQTFYGYTDLMLNEAQGKIFDVDDLNDDHPHIKNFTDMLDDMLCDAFEAGKKEGFKNGYNTKSVENINEKHEKKSQGDN